MALVGPGCKSTASSTSANVEGAVSSPAPSGGAPELGEPPTQKELPTTDGAIAFGNLDSQLRGAEKELESRPRDLDARSRVIELYATRARFGGKIADLEKSAALGEEAVK